jgi:hypothetical protein
MAAKKNTSTQSQTNTVIDTESANLDLTAKVNALEDTRRKVSEGYKNEKKVTVSGSPMYRPYFGNNMPIIINGVAVYVPLDGQQYEIPESFAAVFLDRISRIDEQINMRKQMSAVSENVESYAGEKNLIKRV